MQVTGIIWASVSGFGELPIKEGTAKLNTGGFERTPIKAGGRLVGFSEKALESKFEGTLVHTTELDLEKLNALHDETLTVETDTGVVFVIGSATTATATELSEGEGDTSFSMFGDAAVKQ